MSDLFERISTAIMEGDSEIMPKLVERALKKDISAQDILDKGLVVGMSEVGVRFKRGDMFVPEVLMSAEAMAAGMEVLRPELIASGAKLIGKILMGTVKGDLHDIGKNLVCMMLEGAGFEVIDLGTDVTPEKFIGAVQQHGAELVGLSALLTTTMPNMKTTVEAFNAAGLREQVKIMIGGAPVTEEYARSIGADGFAPDASRAVSLARGLMGR